MKVHVEIYDSNNDLPKDVVAHKHWKKLIVLVGRDMHPEDAANEMFLDGGSKTFLYSKHHSMVKVGHYLDNTALYSEIDNDILKELLSQNYFKIEYVIITEENIKVLASVCTHPIDLV
jgi:hypothetical protein